MFWFTIVREMSSQYEEWFASLYLYVLVYYSVCLF